MYKLLDAKKSLVVDAKKILIQLIYTGVIFVDVTFVLNVQEFILEVGRSDNGITVGYV